MNGSKTALLFVCAALVVGALVLLVACGPAAPPSDGDGARAAAPCAGVGCQPRDVSGIALFSAPSSGAAYEPAETASVEKALEKGLRQSEASPAHLAIRGTPGPSRCAWRGIARTSAQREQAVRFWLDLDDDGPLPSAAEAERRFMAELDRINAVYPATTRSNFQAIAQGGLSTEYLFLACYADYTVHEYLLGSGPATLTVAYDRQGEASSYGLYVQAHALGEFGDEALLSEGAYEDELSQRAFTVEAVLNVVFGDRESVVFLAPMGAHNVIAVEAWQAVEQWDLQTDDDDVVHAVRYGVPPGDPEHTQTLANLKSRVTTAAATDDFADDRIGNVSGLTQYYRDIGAYGDITPDDGSTTTFTPAQPPPAYSCAGGTAVTSPAVNIGLVHDCEALLAAKDTLQGTATLDWSVSTAVTGWEGITTSGTPSRVTELDLSSESLSGSIPAELGTLFELTTLDLSMNSLTGDIPRELGWLFNLEEIGLSGNSLTGCVPIALREVATNDLSSLNLPYCRPPAPGAPTAGTAGETSVPLSWTALANTSAYRVEHRLGAVGYWTEDDDAITGTSHTVDGLQCGQEHQFRVSAYGSGTGFGAAWSDPSAVLTASTGACIPPVFRMTSYSFSVMEDAAVDAVVGRVTATDDSGEPVTYAVTAGNEDRRFAVDEDTGEITVAGDLSGGAGTTATLTVAARDAAGGEATVTVTVRVTETCDSGTAAPNPASNPGLVADCKTLLGLKGALAATGTLDWTADTAMSDWSGISIGDAPKRVIGVKLRNNGLGGILPGALGDLTGLQDLWLNGNQLTGEIPEELGNLTSLYSLYLDQNQLTGEIPAELGALSDLEDLFLYNNQLTGSIPPEVAGLEELRQLWMTNNQLTGVLPGELADLENLYNLRLSGNSFEGCVPAGLRDVATNDIARLGLEDCPAGAVSAPTGLSASLAEGAFSLTWNAVTGAGLYEAQYTTDAADAETVTWTSLEAVTSVAQTYAPEEAPACGVVYRFRVRARGDGMTLVASWGAESASASLTPNCPPSFTDAPYAFSVAEDAAVDDAVGTVSATDPDADDAVTYAITAGNDDGKFGIDGSTGEITVEGDLDYETTSSYTLTVEASDGNGGTATATVTVTVTDVAEDPPAAPENLAVSLAAGVFSLAWDALTGAAKYEAQYTTDAADAETVTWTSLAAVESAAQTYTPEEAPACGVAHRFRVRAFGDGETYAEVWGAESAASSLTPNCPPAFTDAPYAFAVAEDAAVDDAVGTVSATDPDADDAVTYAITAGNDDGKFGIDGSTGEITVEGDLDYETTPSYTLTVEASDGNGGTATATVTVTVTDVAEDPPAAPENLTVSLAAGVFSLAWDALTGAAKYEVQYTTDAADAETVTWTSLAAVESVAQTYTPEEAPACGVAHRFRVRAFGDGETYAAVWGAESAASSLTPNCPPAFTDAPYSFSVAEDAAVDDVVGTVSATDPDADDAVTYAITAGNDDGKFGIDGSTGEITVEGDLDYETTPSYTLTVEASDGRGGTATATVTVTEAACDSGTAAPDPSDNPGLVSDCETLLGLQDALAGTATLNWGFEAAMTSWDGVTVAGTPSRVTELDLHAEGLTGVIPAELGGLSKLTALWLQGNELTGPIPSELGMLSDLVWLAASDNGLTGPIPPELGDLEDLSQLWLRGNELDGELPRELGNLTDLIIVQIENNDLTGPIPPELGSLGSVTTLKLAGNPLEGCMPPSWRSIRFNDFAALGLSYCEEKGRVPAPGGVSASLSNDAFTVTWDLATGADNYEVERRTGGEEGAWASAGTATTASLAYAPTGGPPCGATYDFRVRAHGDGTTYGAGWGEYAGADPVTTRACNRPPAFDDVYSFSVAEDAAVDDAVGSVSATDPDADDAVTYAITAGNDDGKFGIDGSTGEITVEGDLDYETTPSYTLTVEASDGNGGTATATVTVTVTDVAEDPPAAPENLTVSLAAGVFSLAWDALTGAAKYEVQYTTDAADAETVTWTSLAAVESAAQTYTPEEAPACGVAHRFRVRAFGDGETYAEVWGAESAASSLTPNCPPAFTDAPYSFSVAEDAAVDDAVGTVSATDPDADDAVAYAMTAGNAGDVFAMDGSTGAITVAAGLDYETTSSYTLAVEASDGNGGTATATVTVTVTDVAEDPPAAPENLTVSLAAGVFSLAWDALTGAAKYEAQYTTDAADAETVTWTALTAVTSVAQTYTPEEAPACGVAHRFRVRAFGDGETYAEVWGAESEPQTVTRACNRAPAFHAASYAFSVRRDATVGAAVGSVSATDPDPDDALVYVILAGSSAFTVNSNTGAISVAVPLASVTTLSFTLRIVAIDPQGEAATTTVAITVTDAAEE